MNYRRNTYFRNILNIHTLSLFATNIPAINQIYKSKQSITRQNEHFWLLIDHPEQIFSVTPGSRNSPLLRNEFPLIQRFRTHSPFLLDVIHQVKTKILISRENDTVFQFLLRNARTLCQQFTATITTIRIQRHFINLIYILKSMIFLFKKYQKNIILL